MTVEEVVRQHGSRAATLYEQVRARLGADWSKGKGGLEVELTPQGRTLLHCGRP